MRKWEEISTRIVVKPAGYVMLVLVALVIPVSLFLLSKQTASSVGASAVRPAANRSSSPKVSPVTSVRSSASPTSPVPKASPSPAIRSKDPVTAAVKPSSPVAVKPKPTATSQPSVSQGASGVANNLFHPAGWQFYVETGAQATETKLIGDEAPALPAYRFTIAQTGSKPWNIGFNHKMKDAGFKQNETVRLTFRGRSDSRALITVLMQQDAPPYPHCWKEYVRLTPEWKVYTFDFKTEQYAPGASVVALFLGEQKGIVEVAGMTLERR